MRVILLALLPFCLFANVDFYDKTVVSWEDSVESGGRSFPSIAGYTYPARVDLRNQWGINFGGSFIYWQAAEEGLEIAEFRPLNTGIESEVINQDFTYKPGFQVFLSFFPHPDDWDVSLNYTWYRSNTKTSVKANGLEILASRFSDFIADAEEISSNWDLHFDLGDMELGRFCFLGQMLTARPFIGTRFALIKQKLNLDAIVFPFLEIENNSVSLIINSRFSRNYSRSWSLGPRTGVDLDFLLGYGARIFLNPSFSILFFDYNANFENETVEDGVVKKVKEKNSYLRSNLDLSTGLGWGFYFSRSRFFIDLSLSFDAKVFTGQNVMRHLADSARLGIDGNYGDLYFFGGSAKLRFDF